ncbi:hypothetical protein EJ110_NYTH39305 [Nymphaea thermarum]|nr:hypothetical protein EJ110_NYTH39305 [Nymphaea thermarum]
MGRPHVLLLLFPAQGHVKPLMEFAHRLAEEGFVVTFVNTNFIHSHIVMSLPDNFTSEYSGRIRLVSIPDGVDSQPSTSVGNRRNRGRNAGREEHRLAWGNGRGRPLWRQGGLRPPFWVTAGDHSPPSRCFLFELLKEPVEGREKRVRPIPAPTTASPLPGSSPSPDGPDGPADAHPTSPVAAVAAAKQEKRGRSKNGSNTSRFCWFPAGVSPPSRRATTGGPGSTRRRPPKAPRGLPEVNLPFATVRRLAGERWFRSSRVGRAGGGQTRVRSC